MCKIISLALSIIAGLSMVQAGCLGSPLSYGADFESSLSYEAPYHFGSTYSAPFPHSPLPYDGGFASPPPVLKYHRSGFSPFTTYGHTPAVSKFAHSAAGPSFYNSPLPYGHSGLTYNGFSSPNTHVKYGPPITTTTTTYSTAAAAVAGGSFASPFNSVAAW